MNTEPKFCIHCGGKMQFDKTFKEPWQAKMNCLKCKAICEITYGDQNGGSGAQYCYPTWKGVSK